MRSLMLFWWWVFVLVITAVVTGPHNQPDRRGRIEKKADRSWIFGLGISVSISILFILSFKEAELDDPRFTFISTSAVGVILLGVTGFRAHKLAKKRESPRPPLKALLSSVSAAAIVITLFLSSSVWIEKWLYYDKHQTEGDSVMEFAMAVLTISGSTALIGATYVSAWGIPQLMMLTDDMNKLMEKSHDHRRPEKGS